MKATITFIDDPDGRTDVKAEFDPPLGKGGSTDSQAQKLALGIMGVLHDDAGADLKSIEGDPL